MQKSAFLFAGQGSQYVGMGKDLYETFPESKSVFDKADEVLGFSLSKLCFEGPKEELTKTNNAQPAVLTVSIACWEVFKSVKKYSPQGSDYAAGLSLGEYSALVASGAIDFSDAVYLVRRRGEFMEEEAQRNPGQMLSVIGLDLPTVKCICNETGAEVANINCPGQIVLSGSSVAISAAQLNAQERGAKMSVLLDVSGAFHSSFMKGASVRLAAELEKIQINTPEIPFVCNVTGGQVSSPEEIKKNLIKQVASSVLWDNSMRFILSKGITHFIEFGPGKVLKVLLRRIDSNAQVVNIEKKDDVINAVGSS
jgi:[acyl-carrier-protein] S-malonyltransferase